MRAVLEGPRPSVRTVDELAILKTQLTAFCRAHLDDAQASVLSVERTPGRAAVSFFLPLDSGGPPPGRAPPGPRGFLLLRGGGGGGRGGGPPPRPPPAEREARGHRRRPAA